MQFQTVQGQGGGAGAADTPPTPPGGNPATPGGAGDVPPPPVNPSTPSSGGLVGGSPTSAGLTLPTVLYIPPSSSGADMNATEPYFPAKSVSCQQCRYFYPKLVECNAIANQTLSQIPQLGGPTPSNGNSSITNGPGSMPISKSMSRVRTGGGGSNDGSDPEYDGWDGSEDIESMMVLMSKYTIASKAGTATSSLSDPTGIDDSGPGASGSSSRTSSAPSISGPDTNSASSDRHHEKGAVETPPVIDFTTIMPFLQCICPNEGLAAAKVCLTCFRVSNQRNFLEGLTQQNVTTSLSAFAEACTDSQDGTKVPPSGTKGQSASGEGRTTVGLPVVLFAVLFGLSVTLEL
ncbi:hypothetical protein BGZ83_000817 [Gryganskiella cystojenkinii]|nr:hypothetical protein BGZ83_000817 [Gryganskiella cystojenkinii]